LNKPDERTQTPQATSRIPDAILGAWNGTIEVAGMPVAIVLHIDRSDAGLSATADFPQQGRTGFAFSDVSFEQGIFRFTSRSLGVFAGAMSSDSTRIDGACSNKEQSLPLVLRSGDIELGALIRPQTPTPPFGYDIEHVQVDNAAAHCRLAGTLTVPTDRRLRAVALLINGSGALDRDETVFGHKPFWVLADHLSRRGYAVLRLDDRGIGESTGDRSTITTTDEADDMTAALDYLQQRPELQGIPVGLIGHSMGSSIGRIVAARRMDSAFVVSMAGAGLEMGEVMTERECQSLERMGTDADAIAKHREFSQALFRDLRDRPADTSIDAAQIAVIAARFGAADTAASMGVEAWINRYNEPWFRSALRLDHAATLRQVKAPFLAINGSLDVQVPATANLAAMAQLLQGSNHPDFEIAELPGLNHLFQTCTTGEAYAYPIIEETFAPAALETIRTWLDARFPPATA
jgi:pimeloyl-ACP methyl ester carboxylesterase